MRELLKVIKSLVTELASFDISNCYWCFQQKHQGFNPALQGKQTNMKIFYKEIKNEAKED